MPVSAKLIYPEADATVPIHPETPTSGHNYLCILLAKGAITPKSNEFSDLSRKCKFWLDRVLQFPEERELWNFKICRCELSRYSRLLDASGVITGPVGHTKLGIFRQVRSLRVNLDLDLAEFIVCLLRWVVGE